MFKPWIGKQYKSGGVFNGKKLLIVGESHYSDEWGRQETIKVVQNYLKNESAGNNHWKGYFTKITKICKDVDEDKLKFWNSVAFYNYIQISLEEVTSQPTEREWKYPENEKYFKEVLKKLIPDYMLVCGKRLWQHLPDLDGFDENKPFDYSWYYNGGRTLSTFIYHPSRYSYGTKKRRSREIFRQLISETKHLK